MFSTNIDARIEYTPGDPILIKTIVSQLKSQGVFDQFRKECISDVDTKPAYQNLCHRVDGRVAAYLSDVKWGPDLNKNQLRENIRKHVNECTFVDSGICRIVDQLVNPRINTVLVPKVEDIVYGYLGIERPENDRFRNNQSVSEKTDVLASEFYDEKSQPSISSDNDRVKSSPNQQIELSSTGSIFPDFRNGNERKPSLPFTDESTNLHGINACSDIDSDEDDISPPFEPHEKSDNDVSAESDYSMDISDTKYDVKSEPSEAVKLDTDCSVLEPSTSVKPDDDCDKMFRNLERICGEESMDSATSSCTDKMSSRKPSSSLDLPNTPTINYETSDESQDNQFKKNLRRDSVQNEICAPDTSSMDSFVGKSHEGEQTMSPAISTDDASVGKSKNEDVKENADLSRGKKSETKSSDSKDAKRDHKSSSSKRDKHYKSEKDRKSSKDKDRDRSSHESKSQTLKMEPNHSRKEHTKEGDKHKHSERSTKENDSKYDSKHRDSSKASSSSDKSRPSSSSRPRTDGSKDDRKKKSTSSKSDHEKDRERSKHRKEENSEVKKNNKTQCSSDKKMRNNRRSSDRDSSGPSSTSNSSSQRSSSKSDKEKYRHSSSSSSSSSHKTKKNVGTKDSDHTADALFDTMLSVTGSAVTSNNSMVNTKGVNIENTSSLLDILNDNSDGNTSRTNAACKESKSSSTVGSRDRKKDGESSRSKESKKKPDHKSNNTSGSSRKNSAVTDISEPEVKKPKLARNASDILRVVELRKQYVQKLEAGHSSVQGGPEKTSSERGRDSSEDDSRRAFSNQKSLDDPRTLEEVDQNQEGDAVADSFGDCKLKIKRIDSRYRLVNGSCSLNRTENEHADLNASYSNNCDNSRIEDSNDENIFKLNAQARSRDRKSNGSLGDFSDLKIERVDSVKILGCDMTETVPSATKSYVSEEDEEVRYFEPPKLDTGFIDFVTKLARESEETYLENFSIQLKCSERYDHIFRNQLGAIVKRKGVISESSPLKYNSEIIDHKIGNEKGIMMRIKKAVPVFASPHDINFSNGVPDEAVSDSRITIPTDISANYSKTQVSNKRKTLGIKKRISNHGKITSTKIVKRNQNIDVNGAFLDSENRDESILDSDITDDGRSDVGSCESLDGGKTAPSSTPDSQRSFGSNSDSVHSAGLPTPKIPKVMTQEQKRKQFYYDANDLYKPRPSFLFSSRRSRGLDPNKE